MLPKRSGFGVCQDLRAAGVNTPLLMLTAKDGELDEVEGLDVGADDFLRKPFENSVLMARLHALLRRQDRGRPQPLIVGPISLDPLSRHVIAYGRDVTLTPREFALLEFLMGHANATLAKTEILHAGLGRAASTATPTSSRSTSGTCGERSISRRTSRSIRTVRGFGYSVRSD